MKKMKKMKKMILVEGGTFLMGNTQGDSEGENNETPIHEVELTYDYWIGKYPVTFDEYDKYSNSVGESFVSDSGGDRGTRPVINVSWWVAATYCNWLSRQENLSPAYNLAGGLLDGNGNITEDITKVEGYRLPTEAEWEYAARGGQKATKDWKYSGSDNIEEVAWYSDNSNETHPVGEKKPNELGIFDMSGNVYEWCHNWYAGYSGVTQTDPIGPNSGTDRVSRGGSWSCYAQFCRVAEQNYSYPRFNYDDLGFRIARTCSKKEQAC
jgi:formylglycine-generating enzyme required for sulfatase activity